MKGSRDEGRGASDVRDYPEKYARGRRKAGIQTYTFITLSLSESCIYQNIYRIEGWVGWVSFLVSSAAGMCKGSVTS